MTKSLPEILKNQPVVVDGAMATELEKHDIDTDNDLWSAMALIEQPEAIYDVHKSYFDAGAQVAITNTYQANIDAFVKAGVPADDAQKMITNAVEIAKRARDDAWTALTPAEQAAKGGFFVAGSVGPYGAFLANGAEYTGDYNLSVDELKDFHRSRMQLLANSGVDLFAFETQPQFKEAQSLANLLESEFPQQSAWISFSIRDSKTLCDGTSLAKAVSYFNDHDQIIAIGVNCTAMTNITAAIQTIKAVTDKPIIVYPNTGETYDPKAKTWQSQEEEASFEQLTPAWLKAGARMIGGCCRTTPKDIHDIADVLTNTK